MIMSGSHLSVDYLKPGSGLISNFNRTFSTRESVLLIFQTITTPWRDIPPKHLGGTSLQTSLEGCPSKQPWRDIPSLEKILSKCGGTSLQAWREFPPSWQEPNLEGQSQLLYLAAPTLFFPPTKYKPNRSKHKKVIHFLKSVTTTTTTMTTTTTTPTRLEL